MAYNPVREGLEAGYTRDANGNIISGRVVWTETATRREMEIMFEKNWANFAIVQNNTSKILLVTDEDYDGYTYAEELVRSGTTNWHILKKELSGEIVREEPEDSILPYIRKKR